MITKLMKLSELELHVLRAHHAEEARQWREKEVESLEQAQYATQSGKGDFPKDPSDPCAGKSRSQHNWKKRAKVFGERARAAEKREACFSKALNKLATTPNAPSTASSTEV